MRGPPLGARRMRLSRYPVNTTREVPAEAEVVSHQLMLRAGLIRRIAAGLYAWMPIGLRTLRKAEALVREEMDRAGALELLMPSVQPAELRQESARRDEAGPERPRLQDRHERLLCAGPAHEEVIADIARRELKSYRQLPVTFYHFQTRFRDDVRPRFGVLRARELLMMDACSFHMDEASSQEGYRTMYDACVRILTRMGFRFRAVQVDPGTIGGHAAREFHALTESGEDTIAYSDADDYAASLEAAAALPPTQPRPPPGAELARVATPGARTIDEVSRCLGVPPSRCVKTLLVEGSEGEVVALALRGDHELNAAKAQKLPGVASPLRMASAERIIAAVGCEPGYIGPVGLRCRLYADHSALALADFVCGANEKDAHLTGVNWDRDVQSAVAADLRNVVPGDPSPSGKGALRTARSFAVGHIFQPGREYSESMRVTVLDEAGRPVTPWMGRCGIDVTRVVAAAIEQNHDERGIIWPEPIAPFRVVIVPINLQKSYRVREVADRLYAELNAAGIDALYDDRDARPGVKLADAELLGIPHRIVVAERGLDAGVLEYRHRRDTGSRQFPLDGALAFIRSRLGG